MNLFGSRFPDNFNNIILQFSEIRIINLQLSVFKILPLRRLKADVDMLNTFHFILSSLLLKFRDLCLHDWSIVCTYQFDLIVFDHVHEFLIDYSSRDKCVGDILVVFLSDIVADSLDYLRSDVHDYSKEWPLCPYPDQFPPVSNFAFLNILFQNSSIKLFGSLFGKLIWKFTTLCLNYIRISWCNAIIL